MNNTFLMRYIFWELDPKQSESCVTGFATKSQLRFLSGLECFKDIAREAWTKDTERW